MIPAIQLLRPQQWVKNAFVFLPIFFGQKLSDTQALWDTSVAFIAFCFIASSVYVLNDIQDIESDKVHPTKKNRPLASGALNINQGRALFGALVLITSALLYYLNNMHIVILISIYLIQNILYSLKLKQIALVDVFIIAIGFVLRVLVGASAAMVEPSQWILLMTFLLAIFLGISKRYDDIRLLDSQNIKSRRNLKGYNKGFISHTMGILSSVIIMAYIMYTISPEVQDRFGSDIFYSSIFVCFGILRYLQLTFVYDQSGSPTKVLYQDRTLQAALIGWLLINYFIIYHGS